MKKISKELSKLNFKKQTIVKLNELKRLVGGNDQPNTGIPTGEKGTK